MNSRLPFLLFLSLALTSAYELTIKRVKPPQELQARTLNLQITVDETLSETSFDLKLVFSLPLLLALTPYFSSVHDLIYIANVSLTCRPPPSHQVLTLSIDYCRKQWFVLQRLGSYANLIMLQFTLYNWILVPQTSSSMVTHLHYLVHGRR